MSAAIWSERFSSRNCRRSACKVRAERGRVGESQRGRSSRIREGGDGPHLQLRAVLAELDGRLGEPPAVVLERVPLACERVARLCAVVFGDTGPDTVERRVHRRRLLHEVLHEVLALLELSLQAGWRAQTGRRKVRASIRCDSTRLDGRRGRTELVLELADRRLGRRVPGLCELVLALAAVLAASDSSDGRGCRASGAHLGLELGKQAEDRRPGRRRMRRRARR